jgi:hypothetical protein
MAFAKNSQKLVENRQKPSLTSWNPRQLAARQAI